MSSETALVRQEAPATAVSVPMNETEIQQQVNLIQRVMKSVMKDGEHYGVIPGCGIKPSLLKPGAEKLSMTFRMAPEYNISTIDLPGGHREYRVTTTLRSIITGTVLGQGVGSCSTMEGKYRFRTGEIELTGKPVPKEYWTSRDVNLLGGKGFVPKKNDGRWEIARQGERVEHDNPADYWNTCLKMAKKRSHVDAVLTATAASDIFTQDVEDMPEVIPQGNTTRNTDTAPVEDAQYQDVPPEPVPTGKQEAQSDETAIMLREIEQWLLTVAGGDEDEFNRLLDECAGFISPKDGSRKTIHDRDGLSRASAGWLKKIKEKARKKLEAHNAAAAVSATEPADDGLPF